MAVELSNSVKTVFSGADVVMIFGAAHRAEATNFNITIQRDGGFIWTLGRKEPIGLSQGKRAIAGSFTVMQPGYDTLLEFYDDVIGNRTDKRICVRKDEMVPMTEMRQIGGRTSASNLQFNAQTGDTTILNTNDLWVDLARPNYLDQMPPIDITMIAVNEQGHTMACRLWGLKILQESFNISIDDVHMEKRCMYIAQAMSRQQRIDKNIR